MALFFAIAGKEVWESILPGGALSNPKKAATPLLATAGGVLGPAAVYLTGCVVLGQMNTLGDGWAVPCATDIAFSYLVARIIFGTGSPAGLLGGLALFFVNFPVFVEVKLRKHFRQFAVTEGPIATGIGKTDANGEHGNGEVSKFHNDLGVNVLLLGGLTVLRL